MPERQHAPGETDEHPTPTAQDPAGGNGTGNGTGSTPSPRPVMPSPKPRPNPPPTADDTVAVGAVPPRTGDDPDHGQDATVRSEPAAEPPTVAGSQVAAQPGPNGAPVPQTSPQPDPSGSADAGRPDADPAPYRTLSSRVTPPSAAGSAAGSEPAPQAGPMPGPAAGSPQQPDPMSREAPDQQASTQQAPTQQTPSQAGQTLPSPSRPQDPPQPGPSEAGSQQAAPQQAAPEQAGSQEAGSQQSAAQQGGSQQPGTSQQGGSQRGSSQQGGSQPGSSQPGPSQPSVGRPSPSPHDPAGTSPDRPQSPSRPTDAPSSDQGRPDPSGPAAAAGAAGAVAAARPSPSARPDTGDHSGDHPTAPQQNAASVPAASAAETTARVQAVPPSPERAPGSDPSAGNGRPDGARPSTSGQTAGDDRDRTVSTAASAAAAAPTAPITPHPPSQAPGTGSDENTQVLPKVHGADVATAQFPDPSAGSASGPRTGGPGGSGPTGGDGDDGAGGGRPRRRGLLVVGALVALLVLAYLGDLLFSSGSVPRGVVVAGQQIGGMSRAAAIEKLQGAIEPRSSQLIQVTAGVVRSEVDPKVAGLAVDYQGTLDRAGAQPLNPITRVTSFFGTRDVPVVNKSDERSVRTAMEQLAPVVDRDPKDGNVRFEGVTPLPVAPEPGQRLDVDAAISTLEQQWASGAPVALPLITEQPSTTPEDVQQAIDEVARPAVSGPLTVTGEGANATVEPEDIAQALTFKADPAGPAKLVPQINVESLTDVTKPQLASTEKPAVDASLDLAATPARVVPSVDGRGIDYKATFADLVPVLTGTGPRTVAAVYAPKPAELTTQEIQSLGSATEISTFTTGGFASDSGVNIRRAAEAINGKIVAPGETFSLNRATDPRDASTGYVEAGIIEDGHPAKGVGGGVSQLATTLYNASYFAGMTDVEHKEHSYYISRYPVAREATVFENLIDVKFRNDGPTPVLIRTAWTPSNVTVKFLGQKQWEVTSETGPRTNPTPPQLVTLPPGQPCSPSKGSPGFTATDTRTMRNVQTGETTSKTRTVRYNPQPIVKCG